MELKVIPVLIEKIEQDDEERVGSWRVVNDDYKKDFIEIIRPYDGSPEQPLILHYDPNKTNWIYIFPCLY